MLPLPCEPSHLVKACGSIYGFADVGAGRDVNSVTVKVAGKGLLIATSHLESPCNGKTYSGERKEQCRQVRKACAMESAQSSYYNHIALCVDGSQAATQSEQFIVPALSSTHCNLLAKARVSDAVVVINIAQVANRMMCH